MSNRDRTGREAGDEPERTEVEMEALIRVKQFVLGELRSAFDPGEQVEAAISCGPSRNKEGTLERPEDRDYLVLTHRRFFYVQGEWFKNRAEAFMLAASRDKVKVVDVRNFLLGSNITFEISEEMDLKMNRQFTVGNIGKADAETFSRRLTPVSAKLTECPACARKLDDQFAFCPYCKFSLRRVCKSCGRELNDDWINCPFCGK